jgi:hypothetical protein
LPPLASPPAAAVADHGWDPLVAPAATAQAPSSPNAPSAPGTREAAAGLGPATAVADGTQAHLGAPSVPTPTLTEVASMAASPRHQGTPDLGILSPLAGTVPAGGLLAWAQPAPRTVEEAPAEVTPLPEPPATVAPPASLATFAPAAPPTPPPPPAPAPTGAAAWNALPPRPQTNGVGPATQARSTADGLRKLTRRVPGASLPQQDDSLRRPTPTTTTRNPLGLTGALAQYLSATANDGRAEKEQNPR